MKLTAVPCTKLRLRMYRTFLSSSFRIFPVVALRRLTSCSERPRLFTSSMLRRDSVVAPASAVVSATMTFWIVLMRRLSSELSPPSNGTVIKNAGAMGPMHGERVHDDEHHADQTREEDV